MISSTPIFATADVVATLAFYKDVLGFNSSWTWGEPPNFGGASLGGVSLMFCLQPDLAAKVRGHMHWIKVEDADELYEKHRANGAKVIEEIEDRPWNCREYVVEDPNGYHLRIAGPPLSQAPKSQPFPEGVSIERRMPTADEYIRIAGKAFGYKKDADMMLEGTWGSVIASSTEGEAIGMLRIMRDAPGWFSIWDVAVVPEWQARRIGSKLMQEAMAMIKEVSPGANVFLFTYQHGFYERLGFGKQIVCLRQA